MNKNEKENKQYLIFRLLITLHTFTTKTTLIYFSQR